MITLDSWGIEMKLDGINWTDVTSDVIGAVYCSYGINGHGPIDRVASTGILNFRMNNSQYNSASLLGYYSPSHNNCRTGFDDGLKVRLFVEYNSSKQYKFYGRIPRNGISVSPMQYGARYTDVTVEDWIGMAAQHELELPLLQTNKAIEDVAAAIIANLDIAPLNTQYGIGQDVFPSVFDTIITKTVALSEFSKVAKSEYGYIYRKGNATDGETLVVEGRHTRLDKASEASFADTMIDLGVSRGKHLSNRVKVTTYPREIDTVNAVLFTSQREIEIAPGETIELRGAYKDPDEAATRVAGKDMVSPAANTDYIMNDTSGGGGNDITADLAVNATYGANEVNYELTNNNASTGYITTLQARGKGIYLYDSVMRISEDSSSINTFGSVVSGYDMAYQDDPVQGKSFADVILERDSNPRTTVDYVSFNANRNANSMSSFVLREPGDRFTMSETVTAISGDYYINGIEFTIDGDIITYTWYPITARDNIYWNLGTTGLGEIGETTYLGW